MKKNHNLAGLLIIPSLFILGYSLFNYKTKMDELRKLIPPIYSKISGEDRILNTYEKRKFLDDFGFINTSLEESDDLSITPAGMGDGIVIQLIQGDSRYVKFPNISFEGFVKTEEIKKYLNQ